MAAAGCSTLGDTRAPSFVGTEAKMGREGHPPTASSYPAVARPSEPPLLQASFREEDTLEPSGRFRKGLDPL